MLWMLEELAKALVIIIFFYWLTGGPGCWCIMLKSCNFCTDMHLPPVCFYIRCCMTHRVHNHMWMLSAPDCPFIFVFLNEVIKAYTYFTWPNHSLICSVLCNLLPVYSQISPPSAHTLYIQTLQPHYIPAGCNACTNPKWTLSHWP